MGTKPNYEQAGLYRLSPHSLVVSFHSGEKHTNILCYPRKRLRRESRLIEQGERKEILRFY